MATATSRRVANSPTQAEPTKRMSLAEAITGSKKLPARIVIHGQGGIGKTSTAAHAPSPFFMLSPGETGLHTLIDAGVLPPVPNIEVQHWEDVLSVIEDLTVKEHPYKSFVIDTIDGLEQLGNRHVCATDYGGDWSERGFMGYMRGYRSMAAGPWRALLAALDKMREVKRVRPILLAHTGVSTFKSPEGDYDRWIPHMYKDAWELTFGWSDIVLFGQRTIVVTKERSRDKGKAAGVDKRFFSTAWTATADAKNRHNLPAEIDMGTSGKEAWNNFTTAIMSSHKNGKEASSNG